MPDVTGEQRGRAFDDPALVDEVEALQQPVVRHLPLELRERPAARSGEIPELVGESPGGRRQGYRTNDRRSPAPGSGLGTSWRLPVLLGRAFGLHSRLLYPLGCFRVASSVEEPAKEREAIPRLSPKLAAYGARASANAPG
jgi:hypothetical protein